MSASVLTMTPLRVIDLKKILIFWWRIILLVFGDQLPLWKKSTLLLILWIICFSGDFTRSVVIQKRKDQVLVITRSPHYVMKDCNEPFTEGIMLPVTVFVHLNAARRIIFAVTVTIHRCKASDRRGWGRVTHHWPQEPSWTWWHCAQMP